jgi:hypothetical protein
MQVNSNNSEKPGKTHNLEFLEPITKRYLMVINISSTCDEKGDRYLDPLWAKDLTEHFRYLKNFTLASPCQQETSPGMELSSPANHPFLTLNSSTFLPQRATPRQY